MHQLLKLGSTVHTVSGHACTIKDFIGGGGQGEVYRADLDGKELALKWYFSEQATPAQKINLEALIRAGAPSAQFLWPMDLVLDNYATASGFGYIMPLREPRFKGIVDLMKRRIEPSFYALSTASLQLAQAFLELHAKGLCYRDISFGNVFFDPNSGDIQICDNDNVAIDDGMAISGVLGTPRFIAPEIVRGAAVPSTQTDLFSLSVLLFYLLHIHHPLEGQREADIKCFDLPAMTQLYGINPLFIFDPTNKANYPVRGIHDNALEYWPMYPTFLRNRFIQAFTGGLHDPQARIRESEWRATLMQMRDSILYCGSCGAENFYDVEALRNNNGQPYPCWSCQRNLTLPFRLRVGREIVMLNHDTKLFPHHIDPQQRYDLSQSVAEMQQHPQQKNVWGLKNLSDAKWVVTMPDGVVRDVEPGRSVSLVSGVKIQFGHQEGEIRF
ncbi:protein kinase domain-containing protein [Chromatium okenii]|uniref:Serine/threonine protein kinase n=1 Tax=Chromatium okenii TaxID=61644 RepID=A0A2S7XQ68_9GAMM|nr:serine/threonine protein kinase [Chromatium okenii]PQJ95879.1 serine/threonine protein kinase [Chromatium okenii]